MSDNSNLCQQPLNVSTSELRKSPQHQGVYYINWHLTFKQRKDLYERRQRVRANDPARQLTAQLQSHSTSLAQSQSQPDPTNASSVPVPNVPLRS